MLAQLIVSKKSQVRQRMLRGRAGLCLAVVTLAGIALVGAQARAEMKSQAIFQNAAWSHTYIIRMIQSDGTLYIAADAPTLKIYRLIHPGCKLWQDVTPPWKTPPGTYRVAMATFNGQLFVGTDNGEIHRLGAKTSPAPAPAQLSGSVESLAVFQGKLYATAGKLYRTSDGTHWEDLGIINFPSDVFTDTAGLLAPFNGHLYRGFGIKKGKLEVGIQLWRSTDGQNWELFKSLMGDFGSAPQHIHAMKAFNGYLYVGQYEGGVGNVYRTNGMPGNWASYTASQTASITALEEHDGKLFAGVLEQVGGVGDMPLLYSTADGQNWSPVPASAVGPKLLPNGTSPFKGIRSIASFGGRLYFGTQDAARGGEVFELGETLSKCQADLPGDSVFEQSAANPDNRADAVAKNDFAPPDKKGTPKPKGETEQGQRPGGEFSPVAPEFQNLAPQPLAAASGVHGRVYALDEKGKLLGSVAGARIELKNQAGAIVAGVSTEEQGYYRLNLPPGQYFFKVTADGYKDEDHGRGFHLELSDGLSIYNFSLVKGENDPASKPPQRPAVQIGRLHGQVWERTTDGERVGVPDATISLRQDGSTQLTKVITRSIEAEGRGRGTYEIILQEGDWRASVAAPGFQMRVDPETIRIESGKEQERDFLLTRMPAPRPEGQGIKGVVRVRTDDPDASFPQDVEVHIRRIVATGQVTDPLNVSATGEFQRDLVPDAYQVEAVAAGYLPARYGPAIVLPGRYTVVDLTLVPNRQPTPSTPSTPDETLPAEPEQPREPQKAWLVAKVMQESIEGRRPLAGASVLIRKQGQALDEAMRGTTDGQGEIRFPVVEPGSYIALAQMPDYRPGGSRIEVLADQRNETIIMLEKLVGGPEQRPPDRPPGSGEPSEPVEVAGYVAYKDPRSSTGLYGVQDAHLRWQPLGNGSPGSPPQTTSGRTGRFALTLPAGEYEVDVSAPPGYRSIAGQRVKVAWGMQPTYLFVEKDAQRQPDIEQDPGATPTDVRVTVQGYVLSPSNQTRTGFAAVDGAQVVWTVRGGQSGQQWTAVSDSGGRFSLALRQGTYTVRVNPPPGYVGTSDVLRVVRGMERPRLVIDRISAKAPGSPTEPSGPADPQPGSLTLTLQIYGRQPSGAGQFLEGILGQRQPVTPLGGAAILISQGRRTIVRATSDPFGRYAADLPPGSYDVSVSSSGYSMSRIRVNLVPSNVNQPIYLDAQPSRPPGGEGRPPGGEGRPPGGEGQRPAPPQQPRPPMVVLQMRVLVSFPTPAKSDRPAGEATVAAAGAAVTITQANRPVYTGRADDNGYLGTSLPPGTYVVQIVHGSIRHNERVVLTNQRVRKTITIQSNAATIGPESKGVGRATDGRASFGVAIP